MRLLGDEGEELTGGLRGQVEGVFSRFSHALLGMLPELLILESYERIPRTLKALRFDGRSDFVEDAEVRVMAVAPAKTVEPGLSHEHRFGYLGDDMPVDMLT